MSVQQVYIALFGRPADPAGLAYWNQVTNNGQNLAEMLRVLPSLTEYTTRYAGMDNTQVITAIYQNLFGRAPDAAGLKFFADALASGAQNMATIAVNILQGAQGEDKQDIINKEQAANLFTASLDTPEEIAAYNGANAAAIAKAFLDKVDANSPATIETVNQATGQVQSGQIPTPPGGGGGGDGPAPLPAAVQAVNGASSAQDLLSLFDQFESQLFSSANLALFDEMPAGQGRQQAVALGVLEYVDLFGPFTSLAGLQGIIDYQVHVEHQKFDFINDVRAADTVQEMVHALLDNVPMLSSMRQSLIALWDQSTDPDVIARVDQLQADPYTTVLAELTAKIQAGEDLAFFAEELLATGNLFGTGSIVTALAGAISEEDEILDVFNASQTPLDLLDDLDEYQDELFSDASLALFNQLPDNQGRQQAVALGLQEYIDIFGAYTSVGQIRSALDLFTHTEFGKFILIRDINAADDVASMVNALEMNVPNVLQQRENLINYLRFTEDQDALDRAHELDQDDYTLTLREIADKLDAGADMTFVAEALLNDNALFGTVRIIDVLSQASGLENTIIGEINAGGSAADILLDLNSFEDELFSAATLAKFDELPAGQGRQQAIALGLQEHKTLFGSFESVVQIRNALDTFTHTENAKFHFITAVDAATNQTEMVQALRLAVGLSNDRQNLIEDWLASGDSDAIARANELANDDYTLEMKEAASASDLKLEYLADKLLAAKAASGPFYGTVKIVAQLDAATDALDSLTFNPHDGVSKFEPSLGAALDSYVAKFTGDGELNDDEFEQIVDLVGSTEDAIKLVWDWVDDSYSYYVEAVNSVGVDIGIIYAKHLLSGGARIDDIVKHELDNNDEGTVPQRLQTMHHNLLTNLDELSIVDKFGREENDPDLFTVGDIQARLEAAGLIGIWGTIGVYKDASERPTYGGYEGTTPDAAEAWDTQFFSYNPAG